MTTVPDTEIHRRPLVSSEPAPLRNSPLLYGLGSFGLESAYKVFWGFYVFYYVDVLGLAVTLAAIVNVLYGIWDAVNDPLVGYLSDNTRTRWGRRWPWRPGGYASGHLVVGADDRRAAVAGRTIPCHSLLRGRHAEPGRPPASHLAAAAA